MDFEPMDELERESFERDLTQALERRPAPPGLKRKVMARRAKQRIERLHWRTMWLQRLAASLLMVAALCGGFAWRNREEQRKGEAARQQVLTALRITNRALNQMQMQLAEHDRQE